MKILFIGGTGNLSLDCSLEALRGGHELYHLNRGTRPERVAQGVRTLSADIRDPEAAVAALKGMEFDAVVDFIAFAPEHVRTDISLFEGRTRQYVFISSASAYRKPSVSHVISESTPLANPFWDYSRAKIACEDILFAAWLKRGFPVTVVRPSHTYSVGWLPMAFGSSDFTIAQRMLDGRPVIVHGDGQSLWTLTHSRDFARGLVGLLGNPLAVGEAVNLVGDEALSWEMIHALTYAALGAEPNIVHIPSDYIAKIDPEMGQHFLGDKTYSALFDNSKAKRLVPGFGTTIPFHEGVRLSVEWYMADTARRIVNPAMDARMDKILEAWNA
jgi:nucleoside-diphosphate-sugar epimerase